MQPLGTLRAATEEISVEDLRYRVPVPEETDDITALARNFNRMLDRIQAGFTEQRRFMSDVGHELRKIGRASCRERVWVRADGGAARRGDRVSRYGGVR